MYKVFIPITLLLLLSCGGEESAESDVEATEESEAVPGSIEQEELPEDNSDVYVPENADGKWQIDDYAEMQMRGKIYNSSEDIPQQDIAASSWYEVLDLKGGYARVTGAYEGWSEYVLWRMADGNDLLGTLSAGCGPVCDYHFDFFIMNDGEKVADGNDLLPLDELDQLAEAKHAQVLEEYGEGLDYKEDFVVYYDLPQSGTSMDVDLIVGADDIKVKLCKLSWDKSSFSVDEAYEALIESAW